MGRGPKPNRQLQDLIDVLHIVAGDCGVDLELQAPCLKLLDPFQCPLKGPGDLSEGIVLSAIGPVNGNADPLDT